MNHKSKLKNTVLLAGVALAMSGCGGALSGHGADAPAVDLSDYKGLMAHCEVPEPTARELDRDGWTGTMLAIGRDGAMITNMMSASGSTSSLDGGFALFVPLNSHSGYGEPEWQMGVRIPTILGKQAVACVREASHMKQAVTYTIPGIATTTVPATIVWDSYGNKALPLSTLPGSAVYGFEFVSNFVPSDGDVFFNVGKSQLAAPSSLSLCFLAPRSSQWDCRQPTVGDAGTTWRLTVRGPQQGVYVLVAPPAAL